MSCAKHINLIMDRDHFSDCTVFNPGGGGGGGGGCGGYQMHNILILKK
jgi:hypothetical protein